MPPSTSSPNISPGADGPLHEPLVTRGKVLTFRARQSSGELGSMFFIEALIERSQSVDEALTVVDRALASLQGGTIGQARMGKLVDELVLDLLVASEQPSARAVHLARRLTPLSEELDRYRRLDVATVDAVARRVLPLDRRVLVRIVPEEPAP